MKDLLKKYQQYIKNTPVETPPLGLQAFSEDFTVYTGDVLENHPTLDNATTWSVKGITGDDLSQPIETGVGLPGQANPARHCGLVLPDDGYITSQYELKFITNGAAGDFIIYFKRASASDRMVAGLNTTSRYVYLNIHNEAFPLGEEILTTNISHLLGAFLDSEVYTFLIRFSEDAIHIEVPEILYSFDYDLTGYTFSTGTEYGFSLPTISTIKAFNVSQV